ncbi:Imm42 family immunity protein [Cupriavidus sp. 30B13]|uniref:Imm42 family immunity protein n=1 Tax=Cupriavidus sp. 30B13 TaxID=3384241 RepID=UPI003B8F7960
MEFGDRYRFSIALEVDRNCGGPWLFGRFCYWLEGKVVGDYGMGTSLRDILFQMKYIIGDRGGRLCPKLLMLPEEKIFGMISDALDGVSDEILGYTNQDFLPARLDVRIPVDVFDCWKIYLVEGVSEAKLLYRSLNSDKLNVTTLNSGEFDTVFESAYNYIERLYQEIGDEAGESFRSDNNGTSSDDFFDGS